MNNVDGLIELKNYYPNDEEYTKTFDKLIAMQNDYDIFIKGLDEKISTMETKENKLTNIIEWSEMLEPLLITSVICAVMICFLPFISRNVNKSTHIIYWLMAIYTIIGIILIIYFERTKKKKNYLINEELYPIQRNIVEFLLELTEKISANEMNYINLKLNCHWKYSHIEQYEVKKRVHTKEIVNYYQVAFDFDIEYLREIEEYDNDLLHIASIFGVLEYEDKSRWN